MRIADLVDRRRILIQQLYTGWEDAINKAARLVFLEGIDTKPGYVDGLIKREQTFPTGLPTKPFGVAIPHADPDYIIRPGLGIVTLSSPVPFREMGNPDSEVLISLIFIVALSKDTSFEQATVLSSLMELFQDEQVLTELFNAGDPQTILSILKG